MRKFFKVSVVFIFYCTFIFFLVVDINLLVSLSIFSVLAFCEGHVANLCELEKNVVNILLEFWFYCSKTCLIPSISWAKNVFSRYPDPRFWLLSETSVFFLVGLSRCLDCCLIVELDFFLTSNIIEQNKK